MPKNPNPSAPKDDPKQSKRFVDMAREVEADERPETFDQAFAKVTTATPTSTGLAPASFPRSGKKGRP